MFIIYIIICLTSKYAISNFQKMVDLSNQNESTISIEEIDNLNNIPTSRRKRRSDKNTISLDI